MTDSRLISFLRRTLAFKGKALALTAGVIFGAMALLVALNTDTEKKHYPNPEIPLAAANNSDTIQVARTMPDPNWGMEINITIFMLIITGAVAGAKFYSDFSSKQRRLEALTLPVSASTRFWSSFIIYTAGTWCVILPSLFIIDACRVLILRSWYNLGEMARFLPFRNLLTLNAYPPIEAGDVALVFFFFGLVLLTQALFAAGSIYLPKNSLTKTAVFIWVYTSILGAIGWGGYRVFFGKTSVEPRSVLTEGWNGPIIIGCVMLLLTILFYLLSYWRLRETEVADRW